MCGVSECSRESSTLGCPSPSRGCFAMGGGLSRNEGYVVMKQGLNISHETDCELQNFIIKENWKLRKNWK